MKNRPRINSSLLSLLLVLSLGLSSCYEATEACLDSNATNFDVYADENCCCNYPSLNINIIKQYNDSTFVQTDTFLDAANQRFIIEEQSFYISDIDLVYSDGTASQVIDTLIREIPASSGNEVTIEDNFGLVKSTSALYTPGSIKENGVVVKVRFMVGLTDEIDMLVPDQMPSSHPLGAVNEIDHFVEGQGYVFIRWKLKFLDIAGLDEMTVALSGSNASSLIELDADFTPSPGSTSQVPLIVDYGKWLQGIDFAADISLIESQILANTSQVFSIQ